MIREWKEMGGNDQRKKEKSEEDILKGKEYNGKKRGRLTGDRSKKIGILQGGKDQGIQERKMVSIDPIAQELGAADAPIVRRLIKRREKRAPSDKRQVRKG